MHIQITFLLCAYEETVFELLSGLFDAKPSSEDELSEQVISSEINFHRMCKRGRTALASNNAVTSKHVWLWPINISSIQYLYHTRGMFTCFHTNMCRHIATDFTPLNLNRHPSWTLCGWQRQLCSLPSQCNKKRDFTLASYSLISSAPSGVAFWRRFDFPHSLRFPFLKKAK